jgi:simple sugar transport system permease protein
MQTAPRASASGLAGGVLLSLNPGGVTPGFAGNYGWDGLLVALVAGYRPLAVIPVALGFGMLRAGGSFVVAGGVSSTIAFVFEATIALAVLIPAIVMRRIRRGEALTEWPDTERGAAREDTQSGGGGDRPAAVGERNPDGASLSASP